MIIKIILISGILLIGLLALREKVSSSSLAVRRLGVAGIIVVGTVLVLWPDITTRAAEVVGVGRGTDLLFYGCVLLFLFTSIAQSQRIHRLEQRLVALTREVAFLESRREPSADSRPAPGKDA
jgi:hypothetical protein